MKFAERVRSDRGQVLPIVAVVMVAMIAAGVLLLYLGFATTLSANAQTAADASALEAEQQLLQLLTHPQSPGGLDQFTYDVQQACSDAGTYASDNNAQIVACNPVSALDSGLGWDMEVTVRTDNGQPSRSPDAGASAYAEARASTDPFSQASPAIDTSEAPTGPCQPPLTGSVFAAHGGLYGFFPSGGANFMLACEPQLAGALDRLGVGMQLHLIGVSGFTGEQNVAGVGTVATAHACGAVAQVSGLGSVSDTVLQQYGLKRPWASSSDQVELVGEDCSVVATSTDATTTTATPALGNTNVHLVPLTGGPAGGALLFSGAVGGALNESQLQVACQIYSVWKSLSVSPAVLFIGLLTAFDESQMGQDTGGNTTNSADSVGVFQQISDDGWGTIPDELNPTTAAEMFFIGAHNQYGSPTGLLTYYDANPTAPPWELAQQTQGSGAGQSSDGLLNYGAPQNMAEASQMQAQLSAGACGK